MVEIGDEVNEVLYDLVHSSMLFPECRVENQAGVEEADFYAFELV